MGAEECMRIGLLGHDPLEIRRRAGKVVGWIAFFLCYGVLFLSAFRTCDSL